MGSAPEGFTPRAAVSRSSGVRDGRIVIVDDDMLSLRMLERLLAASGFTRISSSTDPEEAISRVIADRADLLLLDLHMPKLDGFACMGRLSEALPVDERPAVLMLTADEAPGVKEQALALGVRDFLNKPFPPVETILRVENLLEVRLLTRRLAEDKANLEVTVAQRVAELAEVTRAAAQAELEIERERLRAAQLLSDVRSAFAEDTSLDHSLSRCAEVVVAQLGTASAHVWALSPTEPVLELVASAGSHPGSYGPQSRIPLGDGRIGLVGAAQQLLYEDRDAGSDSDGRPWEHGDQVAAFAACPLNVDGRLLGVLATYSGVRLSGAERASLEAAADAMATAIERQRAAEALRAEQVFLQSLMESLQEGIVACDAAGNVTVLNEAIRRFSGGETAWAGEEQWAAEQAALFLPDGVTPMPVDENPLCRALAGARVRDAELVIKPPGGRRLTLLANGRPIHDDKGRKLGAVVALHDVTERKQVEAELERRTFRDTLTGLANRALFMDRVAHSIASADSDAHPGAVLVVDLDNFRLVNDSLHTAIGDQLLVSMGERIAGLLRPGDTAARLGGDEFAVLLEQLPEERDVIAICEAFAAAVAEPMELGGRKLQVTASIGVAMVRGRAQDAETVVRNADTALNRAKEHGRGRIEIFDEDLRARAIARLDTETALRGAVEGNELVVDYQPEVRLADGRIVAAEALVRWAHPQRGLLQPGQFIPIAEETGLIVEIGHCVLTSACRKALEWAETSPEDPPMVSVNVSARQLADPAIVESIRAAIAPTMDPALLCLEITESVLMKDAEASVRTLRALKALGIRLAVDDFGTGYSSLSYLKRFPLDYLKIDRSFVRGLGRDPEDTAIVSAIVTLARTLGLAVIAEGVETELQLNELRRLECSFGQGFHWSKALSAADMGRLLAAREPVLPAGSGDPGAAPAGLDSERRVTAIRAADDAMAFLAHELRAPLTVISGYAQLLAQDAEEGDLHTSGEALDAIVRQTDHMATMIETLVDLGALESGRLSLKAQTVDLNGFVGQVVADLRSVVPDNPVDLRTGPQALCAIDPSRIRQILTNLLTNAAKFSPPGKPIDVVVSTVGAYAVVAVVDRGPGVPAERIGDVFRKFARADKRKEGRGLGLYMSRAIARAHEGELNCRRAATGGAEFVLELPLVGADVATGAAGG